MTEQMEEMIYREGYRKGYEKGREAATAELITWHDRVCEEMAKRHTADRPKTKSVKYFDDDEKVWKIGEVIVDE